MRAGPGMCGKLNFWLYGFKKAAAAAWEALYASYFEDVGFVRGESCGVVFYHPGRDLSLAVHGDDFTFCGLEEDLFWIRDLMASWFDIKVRAILGPDKYDDKEVVILGRIVRYGSWGISYEADPRHRRLLMERFGLEEGSRGLASNGDKEDKMVDGDEDVLPLDGAKDFRANAARMNFLSLDCPDIQFPSKNCSREMSCPKVGSWKIFKKVG